MHPAHGFQALLLRYLSWLQQMHYAARTVHEAGKYVRAFIGWCAMRGITEPCEVTPSVTQAYQRHLFNYRKKNGKALSPATQSVRLIHLHSFFKWLLRNSYALFDPMAGLHLPRVPRSLPRNMLSHADIETIINTPDPDTLRGLRDRAILEVLYSTGLRRAELAALRLQELDLDAGMVHVVRGKGGRSRRIPIGTRAVAWLDRYLLEARPRYATDDAEDHVFLSVRGKPLLPDGMSKVVRERIQESGIKVNGSCHIFRHSMATHMLDGGADIRYIQEMLGHQWLGSTQIYTQVSIQKLKEVHARTHPARLEHLREPRDKPR